MSSVRRDPRELTPPPADPPPAAAEHRPGCCSEHGQRLVRHSVAGRRWYNAEDPAVVCVMCPPDADERCRWCGGPLFPPPPPPYWQRSPRRAFCKPSCRLAHFRAAAGRRAD